MPATTLLSDLPIQLSQVLLFILLSAAVGIVIYGLVKLLEYGPSSTKEDATGWGGTGGKRQRPKQIPVKALNATGWTLLVDGSNFAHRGDEVKMRHLHEVLEALKQRFKNADILVYCDANLRHKLGADDAREFRSLVDGPKPKFRETHGKSADEVLLKYARAHDNCIVVSNDHFRQEGEIELRIGVPLLKVTISRSGVRLSDKVDIFLDPDRPFKNSWAPVGRLINSLSGA